MERTGVEVSQQTSYDLTPRKGLPGMLYDAGDYDAVSRAFNNASGCNFGDGCTYLAEDTVELPDSAGDVDKIVGFVIRTQYIEPVASLPQLPRYSRVSLLRKGRIWLTCMDDIAAFATVYMKRTTADFGKLFAASTDATAIKGVRCLIGGAAGNVGMFEVDLTQT